MATTGSPKPPWKTGRRRATSDGHRQERADGSAPLRHRRLRRRRQVDPHRPPAATTPRRSSRTSSRRSRRPAQSKGYDYIDLALLTDGLRAEREQGITIDVAYRYFATPTPQVHHRRHPGPRAVHPQHGHRRLHRRPRPSCSSTPATASSSSPAATRDRLAAAASRTSWSRSTRWTSSTSTRPSSRGSTPSSPRFATKLDIPDLEVIPISALQGDNVVTRSEQHAVVLRPDAAAPPRARPRRLRPRPGRRPLPGAVRRPPEVRRAPRLPRLRRHGRRRRPEAGRRGRRAALRDDVEDRRHRPLQQGDHRGVPADVGHRAARGRRRRLPRRHDRPESTTPRSRRRTSTR